MAQKNAALRVLKEFGLAIPVVHVVKDGRHRAARVVGASALVAQHERDILLANSEAHRFAVAFHRAQRRKGWV